MSGSPWRGLAGLAVIAGACLIGSGLWWIHGEVDTQSRLQDLSAARVRVRQQVPAGPATPAKLAQEARQDSVDSRSTVDTPARAPWPVEVSICGAQPIAEGRLNQLFLGADGRAHPQQTELLAVARALTDGDGLAKAVAVLLEAEVRHPDRGLGERGKAAIAESALASNDPDLWFFAWRLCGYGQPGASNACQRLTLQGWIERDPGNGAPWLWIAQQEAPARNAQAVDDAMYRLSLSKFVDPRWSSLLRLQSHPALAPERGLSALLVSVWLTGIQTATATPAYQVLTAYCGASALTQANRRLRCDDIARVLTTAGQTQIDLMFGHLLARNLGWAPERLQALQDLRDAATLPEITMGDGRRSFDLTDFGSCQTRQNWIAQMAEVARHGETQTIARRLAVSGMTLAQAGAKGRALRAASAASAPQSASSPARP